MTILLDHFAAFPMQNSWTSRNTSDQQCVWNTEEISRNKSFLDMKFGNSDENDKATTSSLPSTSNSQLSISETISNRPSCSGSSSSNSGRKGMSKKVGKRPGRKPAKIDERAKLERSRQSAKECRARKKLRYQYLEELVLNREKAVLAIRDELEQFKQWCMQLDTGGKIPEALLKMIANEEISRQTRQVESVKRAAHLKQHQQNQQKLVNSSDRTSTSPPFTSPQQAIPDTTSDQYGASEVSPSRLPNLSPTQPEINYSKGPVLKRQLAFDCDTSVSYPNPPSRQQQVSHRLTQHGYTPISSTGYNATNTANKMAFESSQYTTSRPAPPYPHNLYTQQTPQAGELSYKATTPSSISQNPISNAQQQQFQPNTRLPHQTQSVSSGANFSFFPRHTPPVSRIKSEPPMKYIQEALPPQYSPPSQKSTVTGGHYSSNMSLTGLNTTQTSAAPTLVTRVRSHSNPTNMARMNQVPVSPTEGVRRVDELVSSFFARDAQFNKPKSYSLPNTLFPTSSSEVPTTGGNNLGLFSGVPVTIMPSLPSLTSSEFSSAAMDDSSDISSDDNVADVPLFTSSHILPQKRTLSDPAINKQSFEVPMSVSDIADCDMAIMKDYNSHNPYTDPHTRLNNLTTVHCLSSTRTSNTPSPSPFGMMPRNTDSPFSYSPIPSSNTGYPNTTPSSSNAPSPAPLFSLTSLLELSSTPGFADEDSAMEVSPASNSLMSVSASTTATANSKTSTIPCSHTDLSATISETIPMPEWYSYLEDLEEGGFIPKQTEPEQPVTPVSKFLNVPNFLDEILGDDDKND